MQLNVDVLRISPPSQHGVKIIEIFDQCLHHDYPADQANTELQSLMPTGGSCNGYWHGKSGMDWQTSNQQHTDLTRGAL